jgi:hypothetical protein
LIGWQTRRLGDDVTGCAAGVTLRRLARSQATTSRVPHKRILPAREQDFQTPPDACAKLRWGRARHAGSQHRPHIHSTSITHSQASPNPPSPRPHRPHRTIARRQACPPARCRHDSESMASMAAARRQVRKREENMFGSERRAQGPAGAVSRICSEITTARSHERNRPGCGHASGPARA